MASRPRRGNGEADRGRVRLRGRARPLSALSLLLLALARVPVAAAHGDTAVAGLSRWHGAALALVGIGVVVGTVLLKRADRIPPTTVLYGVFVGLAATTVGAVLFEGLSPDPTYPANTMPFPRSWYAPLALVGGVLVAVASLVVGWLRWPTRPRYTFLGILVGLWVAYPYLVPGPASDTHPLGYVLVLGTPVLVGYVLRKDAGGVLGAVLRDPAARRFGVGVAFLAGWFLASVSGYLSFLPEEGVPHETTVAVLPAIYQLVTWPILEIYLPHVPLFVAVSPGQVVVMGSLSVLVGLNAAVIARHWRVEERAGMTEGTAGTAAIVGSCTCGCCGPLVAKVAILAAGPSVAAPLYWLFVDSASPLGSLFVVGSIVLFTATLVYSVEAARRSGGSSSVVPAD